MRGSFAADLAIIGQRQPPRLCPFLQRGLGIARRGKRGAQPLAPQLLDAGGRSREAGIEEHRSQHGLQRIGQDRRADGCCLRFGVAQPNVRAKPDFAGNVGESRGADERGIAAR